MSRNLATLIGLSAILMWASLVGVIKYISLLIDSSLAITLIYTLSAILVIIFFKFPNFNEIPKNYLMLSSVLFVSYELCFSFAIALSNNSQQAIEVSIVHYLWPSFTVLAFIAFKEIKFNPFIVVGLAVSLFGIIFIQAGSGELTISGLIENFNSNPLSYILALSGAIIWSLYCVVTKKMSRGYNPISILFLSVSIILWIKLGASHELIMPSINLNIICILLLASGAMGFGYAAWNIGILNGNIAIMVVASYFTPVISSVIAMFVLNAKLSATFWQGTAMVTIGSLICWISTNWIAIRPLLGRLIKNNL
ncbi:aromatic amino acid DMT transporter YddG [Acinetobacter baumannii]|uniref:aromatic amino acid DMT transporter YddG n=1 Tax=Acinetobacter baumannii TaxID=470 RepID=UPI003A8A46D6